MSMSKTKSLSVAEIKVSYKNKVRASERRMITSSKDAVSIFRDLFTLDIIEYKEYFKVLYLNRNNRVLGVLEHSLGGVAGTVADIKQIIGVACKANASGLILAHNHPSGNTKPSVLDVKLTKQIKEACEIMDLKLLDHVILTAYEFYSFADEGAL